MSFMKINPPAFSYFEGLAVAGVQNWNRDKAVVLPGKIVQCGQWTAYRYVPSGAGSLPTVWNYIRTGLLLKLELQTPLGNGQLDVTFSWHFASQKQALIM